MPMPGGVPSEYIKQKRRLLKDTFYKISWNVIYPFNLSSGETLSFFLPLALREARTLLPFGVDILSLKPCLFALFLLDGWYVLFIFSIIYVD
jgi:hypothetical protein